MARNIVIIGTNRGIGLELVRTYKSKGDNVVAVCRSSSTELEGEGVHIVSGVDVKNDSIVTSLASMVPYKSVDILIHNAGIFCQDSFPEINLDQLRLQFEINTLGPLKTVLALREKLIKGSKVGLVTSRVGSIADNSSGGHYGYRTSKTALNMIGKCLSLDLKERGVAVAMLHPGYVRTDMTNGNGMINADESAKGLYQRMEELSIETSGIFIHTSGEKLLW